jgi:triosephosphate isomerase
MARPRRPLIAGNWKMNGLSKEGVALARDLAGRMTGRPDYAFDMAVCPPFTLVGALVQVVAGSGIAVGGQDCHPKPKGAHTGDVSAAMLADLGCRYVIVGHSERRADHGETDALVAAKAEAAIAAGLTVILCIGETEAERDAGRTLDVVKRQIDGSLPKSAAAENLVIAYEPVWAIGTGRTPTTAEVAEVHARIRTLLGERLGPAAADRLRILYGGSMKPSNAREILALADVDGGLVGGASLNAADFWAIAEACPD